MSYEVTARRLEAGAERDVDELVARLAARVDAVIRPIEGGIRTVAYQLEEVDPPQAQYPQRIRGILRAWPDVYGSTIAVEVGSAGTNARPFAPIFSGAVTISALPIFNPQPAVRKALDIVQAIPPGGVFASVEELDAYLDLMQRRVRDPE